MCCNVIIFYCLLLQKLGINCKFMNIMVFKNEFKNINYIIIFKFFI